MMMKLLHSSNPWRHAGISRLFRVLFFSSETLSSSASSDSLYHRISRAGDPRVSIVPLLEQWSEEGRSVKQQEFRRIVRQLRSYRRFKHCLQIFEWMSDRMKLDLSPGDIGVRLDLISKVHGLEQAEKYFNSIPDSLKGFQAYGALLNCYAHNKSLEKAEDLMQKMRELGFWRTSLSYNVMLNLYSHMEKYDKLDILVQEMEEKGISCDSFTSCIRLSACVATSDVEGIEKLLMKMEADPLVIVDWNAYAVAANGYLQAGLTEKTLTMLKKLEQVISGKSKRFAYEYLLTLYTTLGNKDEVYRIWNLYKNVGRSNNNGYVCIISSLVKLDDIDGAEKIFEEWESGNTCFDFRIPNLMVSAYCKNGLLEKAEAFVSRLIESGKEPNASTWDRLALGYHMDKQTAKAVEMMKKAILASRPGFKPHRGTLAACLEFLKGKGDVEVAGEFIKLLREKGSISTDACDRLEKYIKDRNPGSIEFDRMGGVSIDTCNRLENDIKDGNLESITPVQMGEDDEARDGEMHGVMDFEKKNTN